MVATALLYSSAVDERIQLTPVVSTSHQELW